MTSNTIVIIGAGLGGLSLALALHQRSIPVVIYEARLETSILGGAVMLSPNALRVLDSLGVYTRIQEKGFHFDHLNMETDDRQHIATYHFGSVELFGYKALRIYRKELVHELVSMLRERGVLIHFGNKFMRVVSESSLSVSIELADGSMVETPMLVGADGIHSSIRKHIAPETQPRYLGQTAIAGAVKTSKVRLPNEKYALPVSIFGKPGVFILAPQHVDGSELLAGTQYALPEPDREETRSITNNPSKMIEMLNRDRSDWSDLVQSAMTNMIPESMYIWPFYSVPVLTNWSNESGSIIILGDAAHAIPPTLGQGANQAFEEGLGLAIIIEKLRKGTFPNLLSDWVQHRTSRIAELMQMTTKMNNNRLPRQQRELLSIDDFWHVDEKSPGKEMQWLYDYSVQDSIETILKV